MDLKTNLPGTVIAEEESQSNGSSTSETKFIIKMADKEGISTAPVRLRTENQTNIEINTEGEDTSYCGSMVSTVIFIFSALLIILTFPFSLCVCIKMVQVRNVFVDFILLLNKMKEYTLIFDPMQWFDF